MEAASYLIAMKRNTQKATDETAITHHTSTWLIDNKTENKTGTFEAKTPLLLVWNSCKVLWNFRTFSPAIDVACKFQDEKQSRTVKLIVIFSNSMISPTFFRLRLKERFYVNELIGFIVNILTR